MKTLIISHNDLDGIFSAAGFIYCDSGLIDNLLKLKETNLDNYDLIILPINSFNFLEKLEQLNYNLDSYERLVMLDYSVDIETMKILKEKFNDNFIWIDHHEAVYKEVDKKIAIKGVRDVTHAACTLVYRYFNKEPSIVSKYVEDMDIWLFNLDNTEEILSAINNNLKKTIKGPIIDYNLLDITDLFLYLDDDYFIETKQELIKEGEIISHFEKDTAKMALLNSGIFMFEGYKTIIINSSIKASIFSLIIFNCDKYKDIEQILVWSKDYKSNIYKFSIRSKEHDCNVIAQKYNGNGHKQASGFKVDDLKVVEDNLEKI